MAIVTGTLALSMVLAAAVPAQAFAPKPKPPRSLSSEIAQQAANNAKQGARNAALPGVSAYATTTLMQQGNIPMVLLSVVGQIGQTTATQFGFDASNSYCQIGQALGSEDLSASIWSTLQGRDCFALNTAAINADASSQLPGFRSTQYVWGGEPDPSHTAAVMQYSGPDGTNPGVSVVFSNTVTFTGNPPTTATNTGAFQLICRQSSGDLISRALTNVIGGPQGAVNTYTAACASNEQVYAFGRTISSTATGTDKPLKITSGTTSFWLQDNGYDPLWFSNLSPLYPAAQSADPDRVIRCTIHGSDGVDYVGNTASFKMSSAVWPGSNCPTLPDGVIGGLMTVQLVGGPQIITLSSQDTTAAYKAAATAYPTCAKGACELTLWDTTGDCGKGVDRCADWFADPNKGTKYSCKYGTYSAPLAECNVLANYYDPAKVAAGNAFADPATGADTGVKTSPATDAVGQNAAPDTADNRGECFPTGWGVFNPLAWVFQPVQCAMNWAFVPRQSKLNESAARVGVAWSRTAPYKVIESINIWTTQLPTVSGCAGPHLAFTWTLALPAQLGGPRSLSYDGHPLSACDDPAATLASVGRVIGALGLYYFAALACVRNISGVVGQRGIGEGTT